MPNKNSRKRKGDMDEFNELKVKLKKLERKMLRRRRQRVLSSADSSNSSQPSPERRSRSRSRSQRARRSRSSTPKDSQGVSSDDEPLITLVGVRPLANTANADPPEPNADAQPADACVELSEGILEILGDDPSVPKTFGRDIHKDLATRFEHISTNGLAKEDRKALREKYLIPANCKLIDAPKVNPEVKAAIADASFKRLKAMEQKQKQLASIITCLGEALTAMISKKDSDQNLIKILMDAARLLCDSQYSDSVTRRFFILSSLKKEIKEQLLLTKIDSFLFVKNLFETLKSAKAITKSGAELKQSQANQPTKKIAGNKSYRSNLNQKTYPPNRRSTGNTKREAPAPKNQPVSSSRSSRQPAARSRR